MKDLHVKVLSSDVCSMVGGWSIHRAALILVTDQNAKGG